MRKAAFLCLALGLIGCEAKSPTAPEKVIEITEKMKPVPQVHNLTVGDIDGGIWYVCATQPRQYCGDRCNWEIDYYIQRTECPVRPID